MPKLKYDPLILEEELQFLESLNDEYEDTNNYISEQVKSGNIRDEEFMKKYKGEE